MTSPACPRCGADLSRLGSANYVEHYFAKFECPNVDTVVPSSSTVDSSAHCARCGQELEYQDVDFVG